MQVQEHPEFFGKINAAIQPLLRSKRLADLWLKREEPESTDDMTLGRIF